MRVVLTQIECSLAARVGSERQIQAVLMGLKDKHGGENGDPWRKHIDGAAGELAVCKAMDWYWSATVGTFKRQMDAGPVQVRTRSRPDYELIVRGDDDPSDLFVLVTGWLPCYTIRGWFLAGDARRHPEWVQEHGGREAAWFVPQPALQPMSHLR